MRAVSAARWLSSSSGFAIKSRCPWQSGLSPARLAFGADALLEGGLEADRLAMLLQQILECLVGELLEGLAPPMRHGVDRLPGLVVELHALPGHGQVPPACWR